MSSVTIPNVVIRHAIYAIDEGYLQQPGHDFSNLIRHGVDIYKLTKIEAIVCWLRKEPYLTKQELVSRGVSEKFLENHMGGMDNIRTLLNIQHYDFSDFLEHNHYDITNEVILSYYQYQTFIDDIREHFTLPENWMLPTPTLKIRLSAHCVINSIPLLGRCVAPVPANDNEALAIGVGLMLNDYECLHHSKYSPVVTLKPKNEERKIDIEIRCLASAFSKDTENGICVIDDIGAMRGHPVKRKVMDFPTLLAKDSLHYS
ncbi:hypothetical protein [Vibrio splendidus]|uniref:hypothetical protein n=1 Tax=Vibrio splendidus TaxID=29497 RepID=UPI000C8371C1|nr:hypothetical protein [Vibrio splendidus]PMI54257.1 hypothetical protein BCU42_18615 [Vibrio splendidus]